MTDIRRAPAVAIASFIDRPELRADDRFLREALEARGLRPIPAVWDDAAVDWKSFDACLIRSVSDYHLKYDAFRSWLRRLGRLVPTWNDVGLVEWNADKTHLRRLSERGIPIIPTLWLVRGTEVRLADLLADRGWTDAIVKPTVGLAAQMVRRVGASESDDQRALEALLANFGAMVQPFLPSIETHGETSLIYIDGKLTHTVRKRPATGDFRVQGVWGGNSELCEPTVDELRIAEDIFAVLDTRPLFARVDFVTGFEGRPCLIELEMIEPDLFFREQPKAADALAKAVSKMLLE